VFFGSGSSHTHKINHTQRLSKCRTSCKTFWIMVGAEGFEPPTLCSQSRCATRLRYAPTSNFDCIAERNAVAAATCLVGHKPGYCPRDEQDRQGKHRSECSGQNQ
jgi:hypothetical protein